MLANRTYAKTHPWITFDLDTKRFAPRTWMLLGEAASKCTHIAGVPLAPKFADELLKVFLAKGAHATTAIEGNTLTAEQVEAQIEGKLALPPSQQYLQQEVKNIIDSCNWLVADLKANGPREITKEFCCDVNRRVLRALEVEDGVSAGEIRRHSVVVGNVYRGAPPEDCDFLLEKLCEALRQAPPDDPDASATAILKALFAHIYLALIHPFGDGNGRTARMLEFYILLQHGFPQPTGHLLSNHYNFTRSRYYSELDRISKTGGELQSFVAYALQGFVDGLKGQIDLIRNEQLAVAWENYVYHEFRGKKSAADARRRELVLQLGADGKTVKTSEVMGLSSRLAKEYAGRTERTLSRDLNVLLEMGLIKRHPGHQISARSEIILAFLPWTAGDRN